MTLRPLSVLLACALLLCSAAAVACGGGGGGTTTGGGTPSGTAGPVLTLQEYFQKVQALNSQASQRFDAAQGLLRPNLADDEQANLLRDAILVEAGYLKEERDGLQELSPPPEVKDAHEEAIAALSAFLEYAQRLSDRAATATDFADVLQVLASPEASDAPERLNASCLALQQAAADHGITIALDCSSFIP